AITRLAVGRPARERPLLKRQTPRNRGEGGGEDMAARTARKSSPKAAKPAADTPKAAIKTPTGKSASRASTGKTEARAAGKAATKAEGQTAGKGAKAAKAGTVKPAAAARAAPR